MSYYTTTPKYYDFQDNVVYFQEQNESEIIEQCHYLEIKFYKC